MVHKLPELDQNQQFDFKSRLSLTLNTVREANFIDAPLVVMRIMIQPEQKFISKQRPAF